MTDREKVVAVFGILIIAFLLVVILLDEPFFRIVIEGRP